MRRLIGAPDRQPDGSWVVDQDHLANAERYEREKSRRMPVRIETLSVRPLAQLSHHDGATWLEREMTSNRPERISGRSEAHTSELQSLMSTTDCVLCMKTKN